MRYKIEDIQQAASEHNWTLLSNTYQNLDSELIFKCSEGHAVYTTYKKIRDKWECPVCMKNKYKIPSHKVVIKPTGAKRIIALDQSSRLSGYSIFDDEELVDFGTFCADDGDEIQRGHQLKEWLISMIENWKPDIIGIEGIQYQKEIGVTTFQTLARIQGILMDCCFELGIRYEICSTNTWRHQCEVKGRSRVDKKRSAQLKVKEWYDISVDEDSADAICIGKYMTTTFTKKVKIHNWE